jgi:hypothetical protein
MQPTTHRPALTAGVVAVPALGFVDGLAGIAVE